MRRTVAERVGPGDVVSACTSDMASVDLETYGGNVADRGGVNSTSSSRTVAVEGSLTLTALLLLGVASPTARWILIRVAIWAASAQLS